MKAIVNQDGCISCGLCVSMCPNVFSWDENGKAKGDGIAPEFVERSKEARDSCPVDVIDIK
ncbi:MAG: ferredoxin [Ruminococcaceae bacterium]|nr:ferredoxin [Oscillospiraceae bacterium]